MMPLTKRQREILDYLGAYIEEKQYAPSFEEIAQHFSFSSLATVHEHLTNLEQKGFIRRSHNESRSIEIVPEPGHASATELPLLGQVAAGVPIEAVTTQETIAVPDDLIPRRGSSYVLRVRGDSMIDEHIQDGDFVVVNSRNTAENGEMVIALIDGTSATVKKFYREPGGWIRLQPANENVPPIRVQEDQMLVQGIVVGVIRKY
ncbi:MAG: transcriptional repressor LexA [Gemmatimonadetes bacterium]|nr:transcriptional repressor LexA [Gemmatimonadota bacterium]MCH8143553.1 transcriptional repressor LexA [Gemmatimonadota bacterium]MCH8255620.1 transcriptional repressor LexA [Gemmatimonadota bacterium]MCH8937904.1 transcriptional repressor LexA [Gemmatimonadota bacterium]